MIEVVEARLEFADHARALVTLLNEYALDPMGGGSALTPYSKGNLAAELQRRNSAHVLLAHIDGEPAGLMICFEGFSTFACKPLLNIHDVVVTAQHRGKGVARRMLQHAEALARRLDCCKMTLEVLEGNRVAQAVYRALGFAGYELDPRMGKAMFLQKKLDQSGAMADDRAFREK
ncbi:MAG: GNAT family N-acetyltransferase [Betaproteobacteria bacterium]|nr:GNAT family N-acetyltransferase [Betaproteobacteria bacterium]